MVIRLYLRVRFVSLHAYSGRTQVRQPKLTGGSMLGNLKIANLKIAKSQFEYLLLPQ